MYTVAWDSVQHISEAMRQAARKGHYPAVTRLIKAGEHVDAVTEYGHTALMFAAERGKDDAAEALLAGGA
eukprot:COSAG05_NODE_7524_length_801_cov_1.297721_1_plen_69_part_10